LVASILALVFNDAVVLPTASYYHKLGTYVMKHDPDVAAAICNLESIITSKYRSAQQYEHHVSRVPMIKQVDRRVESALQGDCAICLRPLNTGQLVRLKAANGQNDVCGHFFHRHCIAEYELRNLNTPTTTKTCPMCRESLGPVIRQWSDHESHRPLF
jgi:hypothetical protein